MHFHLCFLHHLPVPLTDVSVLLGGGLHCLLCPHSQSALDVVLESQPV